MRFFRYPRARLRASLALSSAFLLLLGTISHRNAWHAQKRALQASLDALQKRVEALEQSPRGGEGGGTPFMKQAQSTADGVAVPSKQNEPAYRPRVLGSGKTGAWRYTDVRHSNGEVKRYYLRTNSTPAQVSAWVNSIAENERDARHNPFPEVESADPFLTRISP